MNKLIRELRMKYPGDWQPVETWPPGCSTYFTPPFVPNPKKTRIELARLGDVVIGRLEDGDVVHYNVCHVWDDGRGSVVGSDPNLETAIRQIENTLPWADLVKLPKRDDGGEFTHLAEMLADNGGVLSVERDEDGKLCVRVSFAKDGVAFTQAGDGTLLGNVVEAVGCHVGAECPKEGEG